MIYRDPKHWAAPGVKHSLGNHIISALLTIASLDGY